MRTRDELGWKEKHLKTLEMNYGKTKYFREFFDDFKKVLTPSYKNIAEMNIEIINLITRKFGFSVEFFKSSEMFVKTLREERVLDICNLLNGKIYISGNGAREYEEESHFAQRGLELKYTDYQSIEYTQQWGDFIPNLSIVDFICNCGYDWDYVLRKVAERKDGNR